MRRKGVSGEAPLRPGPGCRSAGPERCHGVQGRGFQPSRGGLGERAWGHLEYSLDVPHCRQSMGPVCHYAENLKKNPRTVRKNSHFFLFSLHYAGTSLRFAYQAFVFPPAVILFKYLPNSPAAFMNRFNAFHGLPCQPLLHLGHNAVWGSAAVLGRRRSGVVLSFGMFIFLL